jgi:uncharacterized protein YyaL (SSP411 family)
MIDHFSASPSLQLRPRPQLPSEAAGLAGFYDTSDDHETLITRARDLQDNATPSGNAMAVTVLLKLAGYTNHARYLDIAHRSLAQMQSAMAQYPLGFGQWLQGLSYELSEPREIAIVGHPEAADTQGLLSVVRLGYRPFQVVALGSPHGQRPGRDDVQLAQARQLPSTADDPVVRSAVIPLLQDRGLVNGQAAAYVCRNLTCQAPVADPRALIKLLRNR